MRLVDFVPGTVAIFVKRGLLGAFGIMAYYMALGGWVISYIVNIIGGNLNISSPIDGVVTKGFFAEHIETALGKLRFIRCFLSP